MAKVTDNSDKEADVRVFSVMANGQVGEILEGEYKGRFVMKSEMCVVDLHNGKAWDILGSPSVRILRPDESITLRNE